MIGPYKILSSRVYACSASVNHALYHPFEIIKTKCHVEPPWEKGTKIDINRLGHMTKIVYMPMVKTFIFFSPDQKLFWSTNLLLVFGTQTLQSIYQWFNWVAHDLFHGKVKFDRMSLGLPLIILNVETRIGWHACLIPNPQKYWEYNYYYLLWPELCTYNFRFGLLSDHRLWKSCSFG